jgi:hypothetical protein
VHSARESGHIECDSVSGFGDSSARSVGMP